MRLGVLVLAPRSIESDPLRTVFDTIRRNQGMVFESPDTVQLPFYVESVICSRESEAVNALKQARKTANFFSVAFINGNSLKELSQSAEKFRAGSPNIEIVLIVDNVQSCESILTGIMPMGKLHFLKLPMHPVEIRQMTVHLGMKWLNERRSHENEKLTIDLAGKIDALEKEIRKRKMIEAGIQKSREIFYSFLRHLPAVAFIKDCKGRYVYINEACHLSLNRKPADFIGKTDMDIWPHSVAEKIMEADRSVLVQKQNSSGVDHFEINEEDRYFKTTRFPVLKNGKPYFLAGISFDVTSEAVQDIFILNQLMDTATDGAETGSSEIQPPAEGYANSPNASGNHDIPDALPGLNVKIGLERLGGALNLYIDLVSFLCKDKKTATREIKEMITRREFGSATLKAHSLKGSAATVAADELTAVARALEKACDQEQEKQIPRLLDALDQKLAQVSDSSEVLVRMFPELSPIEELQRIRKKDEGPLGLVQKLIQCLDECDPLCASNYMEKLNSEVISGRVKLPKPDILNIARERICEYDFDAARECLTEIRNNLADCL